MQQPPIDADAFHRFERAGWERVSDAYHRFWGPITGRAIDGLLDAAGVRDGSQVLDVATGPGYVAGRAAARRARVVGVDLSPAMVALAAGLHPGIDFRLGNAEDLALPEGSFDAVVGNFVLLHLGRPERAVAECVRVLRPGGSAAFTVWDVAERCRTIGVLVEAIAEAKVVPPADLPVGPPFFRFSADAEFAALLQGAGLEDVTVRRIAFTHRISAEQLWDAMAGGTVRTGGLIARQTAEVQGRIRAGFHRRVAEYAAAGALEIPVSAKLAAGTKPRV